MLATILAVAAAAAPAGDHTIVFARHGSEWSVARIGALRRSHGAMRLDAARKAFGAPTKTTYLKADEGSNGDPASCVVRWSRLGLEGKFLATRAAKRSKRRCPGSLQLDFAELDKPVFKTDRGVHVGSDAATVKRAYPSIGTPDDGFEYSVLGNRLSFTMSGGRLDEMTVFVG